MFEWNEETFIRKDAIKLKNRFIGNYVLPIYRAIFIYMCYIALIVFIVSILASPVVAWENYTETVQMGGLYSTSSSSSGAYGTIYGYLSNSTNQGCRWMIMPQYMPLGNSVHIYQVDNLANMTDNYIGGSYIATWNGSSVFSGDIAIYNGSFSGHIYQIVVTVNGYNPPPLMPSTGLIDVNIIGTFENSLHQPVALKSSGWYTGVTNPPLHIASRQTGIDLGLPETYTYNYYLNIQHTFDFGRNDLNMVQANIYKGGSNTQVNIFSPDSVKVYTGTYSSNDIFGLAIAAAGSVRYQFCTSLAGGLCANTSKYYGNNYTAYVAPKNITFGNTFTGSLSSGTNTLNQITAICWNYYQIDVNQQTTQIEPFFSTGGNPYEWVCYAKYGSTWYAWNTSAGTYSISKGSTLPNPVILKPRHAGNNMPIKTYIYTADEFFAITNLVNVAPNNNTVKVTFQAIDKGTSAYIPSPTYSIQNKNTNGFENSTGDANDGFYNYYTNEGTILTATASKTGYTSASETFTVTGNMVKPLYLSGSALGNANTTKTNCEVNVKGTNDGVNYYAIEDANVNMYTLDRNETNFNQNLQTNKAGSCLFRDLRNQSTVISGVDELYTFTATKLGYEPDSKSIHPSGAYCNVSLNLQASSLFTPVPTVIPTSTETVTPTITQIGGINVTQLPEMQCVHHPYPSSWGIFDIFRNFVACAGVKGATNQGAALALIVMMLCGVGLSRYGKGVGALAGVIAGAAISFVLQLLPFWIVIFTIVVCGLVFAALITRQSNQ